MQPREAIVNKDDPEQNDKNASRKRMMTWLKRGVTLFFFILIPTLLYNMLKDMDWNEVTDSLQSFSLLTIAGATGITALSYMVFSGYDLLGKRYTRHKLPARQIFPVGLVCYAFNLNLGAWVGGIALRYRLYTRLGLSLPTITRVFTISLIANWLGYIMLAGSIFSLGLMDLPDNWKIGETTLQLIGFALLAVAACYLLACRFSKKRSWTVRGHEIVLPNLKFALLQAALGAINWSLMALLIYLLLPEQAFYPAVIGILMVSSIAGVVTHVPAGLGVLEAIFIGLYQHQVPIGSIVAALIAYRAIYFLLPLSLACVTYLILERKAKQLRDETKDAPDSDQVTGLRTQDEGA